MRIIFTLITFLMVGTSNATNSRDPHSFAALDQVSTQHLYLDLSVDFQKKTLAGFAEHRLVWHNPKAQSLILDTKQLSIKKILYQGQNKSWYRTTYHLGASDPVFGQKLTISLPKQPERVRIYYQTSPEATGLQWLTPAQTAGKKYPFLFSQSQAIHGRSWIPIQDTPGMRLTYTARIHTPADLRAVMSADNTQNAEKDGDYMFHMPQPIPPYLIAIGVGDLHFKAMSQQTGIYAEKETLAAAVAEFSDTQVMIDEAETLYGPYAWGRYDLLILPPSFPFGGMENPRLSFITPTVIAGDKSLVNLIAHELAHSWSGNLVTNATWADLWLNEGFTSYVENRIMEAVFGPARAQMELALVSDWVRKSIQDIPLEKTSLKVNTQNKDPDDSFGAIPYGKGQLFLTYLEQQFGRKTFDKFLKNYFQTYQFQTMTSEHFTQYIQTQLLDKYPGRMTEKELHEWVYGQGLPETTPDVTSPAFTKVQEQIDHWVAQKITTSQIKSNYWSVHEWLYFIENLPETLTLEQVKQLDNRYQFTTTQNAEIAWAWFSRTIPLQYTQANTSLATYMQRIGRMRFIVPLYKLLNQYGQRELALEIYRKSRLGYHPIAQQSLDRVLKI